MQYPTNLEKPLEVHMRKGKLWLLCLGCLVFIAVGGWLFSDYLNESESLFTGILGIVCIALFSACLIFFIRRLFDHSPALVINHEGILDHSSYIPGGFIRWDDIEDIELYQLSGQTMIGIQLKDPDSFVERQQGLKRRLIQMNQGLVQAPVNIAQTALRMPIDQIYGEMVTRLHAHRKV